VILLLNLGYALKRGGVRWRDFDTLYKEEADPWSIGDATLERYDLYVMANRCKRARARC
jgi:hypothetical protein